jgi:hypothetical protein
MCIKAAAAPGRQIRRNDNWFDFTAVEGSTEAVTLRRRVAEMILEF